jgi:hypothetical protein
MKYAIPFMCMLPLAFTLHNPHVAQAANYELGKPFPMTCVGILQSYPNGMGYILSVEKAGSTYAEQDSQCQLATIAERSSKSALVYTLKEETIRRLLNICLLGKLCEISGQMNGLSHDVFFWVQIYSITCCSNIPSEWRRN